MSGELRLRLVVDEKGEVLHIEDDRGRLVKGIESISVYKSANRPEEITVSFVGKAMDRRVRVQAGG